MTPLVGTAIFQPQQRNRQWYSACFSDISIYHELNTTRRWRFRRSDCFLYVFAFSLTRACATCFLLHPSICGISSFQRRLMPTCICESDTATGECLKWLFRFGFGQFTTLSLWFPCCTSCTRFRVQTSSPSHSNFQSLPTLYHPRSRVVGIRDFERIGFSSFVGAAPYTQKRHPP